MNDYKYEIIDKSEAPQQWGKWKALFDPLPFDKAIKFIVPNKERGKKLGVSIQGSLRQKRGIQYRIKNRCIPNGDSALLFVWKIPLKNN